MPETDKGQRVYMLLEKGRRPSTQRPHVAAALPFKPAHLTLASATPPFTTSYSVMTPMFAARSVVDQSCEPREMS
jgi:hypothetical protein